MNIELEKTTPGAALLPCWSCKGPVDARALFCSTCGAVQPPRPLDPFTRLALPPSFDLDPAELDRQYFGFQKRLHPDRFAARTPRERALSQQQAASLNEAYEILKDPIARASALLRLAGREADVAGEGTIADPELLAEAMEMREALDDAKDAAAIERLTNEANSHVEEGRAELSRAFAAQDLDRAGTLLTRLKYLSKLAEEAVARRQRMARKNP